MKKALLPLLTLLMLFGILLCGCARQDAPKEVQEPAEIVPTGILVPTAEFTPVVPLEPFRILRYCWVDESVIYSENVAIPEQKTSQNTLYQIPLDGSSDRVAVFAPEPGISISAFFTDRQNSLYILCEESSQDSRSYCLHKQDSQGQEIYRVPLDQEGLILPGSSLYGTEGFVDAQGNCALLTQNGQLIFFDAAGQYLGNSATELTGSKFLDAGEEGIYLWKQMSDTYYMFQLQKLDMEKFTVSAPVTLDMQKLLGNYLSCTFLSGYENGILVSSASALWQYDPDSGAMTQVLDWNSPAFAIDGSQVREIRTNGTKLTEAAPGEVIMELLLYDYQNSIAETAAVSYIDQAYVPQKQTIVLGANSVYTVGINKFIRQFNRNSPDYYIELREYDDEQLMEALMYGGEDVPDMLEVCTVSPQLLAGLDLLEDLEPYFEKSSLLDREDFLEAAWEGGMTNGKMTSAVISFYLATYFTTSETIPQDGWNAEDLLNLAAENPQSRLLYYHLDSTLFAMLFRQDQFIDWSANTCSFDSPEFIQLLKDIDSISEPGNANPETNSYSPNDRISEFLKGDFLLINDYFSSPYEYQTSLIAYKGKAYNIGFPSEEREIFFRMYPLAQFSIYSESDHKEGAWAFIEYLLTQEAQTWYGSSGQGFPVRKDAFEAYLSRRFHPTSTYATEKDLPENLPQLI